MLAHNIYNFTKLIIEIYTSSPDNNKVRIFRSSNCKLPPIWIFRKQFPESIFNVFCCMVQVMRKKLVMDSLWPTRRFFYLVKNDAFYDLFCGPIMCAISVSFVCSSVSNPLRNNLLEISCSTIWLKLYLFMIIIRLTLSSYFHNECKLCIIVLCSFRFL